MSDQKEMTLNEYQLFTDTTAKFPTEGNYALTYTALGLNGEAGEYAEKVKKILRDKEGETDAQYKQEMMKELGDVLWYLSQCARTLGFTLEEVARKNKEKLTKRLNEGKIKGEGDNR